jgi:phage FluMu gp28-like protein
MAVGREISRDAWAEMRRQTGRATSGDWRRSTPLLSYQAEISDRCRTHSVVFVEKSRRTGATFGAAADAVLRSGSARNAGGMDTLYMGTSADMAREFVDAAAEWARRLGQTIEAQGETLFDDGTEKGIKATRIDFASGFSIVALPSTPRGLRGRQGFVIIDEAAFVDDLREVLKAAIALTMWGGRVLVISTHNGAGNPFAETINDIRAGRRPYGLVRFDLDEALFAGLYERICLVSNGRQVWSPEAEADWRENLIQTYGDGADEELYVVPSQGGGVVLPRVLVEACASKAVPVVRLSHPMSFKLLSIEVREATIREWCERELEPHLDTLDKRFSHALGGDFGRVSDLTVFWPLTIQKDLHRQTPFLVELQNIPFEQQRQILFFICDRLPRLSAVKLDAGGNGAYLAEVATQRYGAYRVEEVKITAGWYLAEVAPFKAAFEDRAITVPADADVVRDLATPVYRSGIPSIPPLRLAGEGGVKRHCDAFVAGVMAYAASRADPLLIEYTPAHADDVSVIGRPDAFRGRVLW